MITSDNPGYSTVDARLRFRLRDTALCGRRV